MFIFKEFYGAPTNFTINIIVLYFVISVNFNTILQTILNQTILNFFQICLLLPKFYPDPSTYYYYFV